MANESTNVDQIFELHISILKDILLLKDINSILKRFSSEINRLNYLDIAKTNNLLTFDEHNHLLGAYPVSPIKSNFKVEIESIGQGYTMCAIDALGIAYTFNKNVHIQATDLSTGELIEIDVDPVKDSVLSNTEFFVAYKDPSKVSVIATQQCPVIQFYSDRNSAPQNDLTIKLLSFQEACEHAKKIFSQESIKKSIKSGFNPF